MRVRDFTISLCSDGFTKPTTYPGLPSEISFQTAMIEATIGLHNVNSFTIYWEDNNPTAEEMIPLFTAAWSAFGSTLEKLSLKVPVTPSTFGTTFFSKTLRELSIHLHELPEGQKALTDTLAPFINKHASTLQILSLSCVQMKWDLGPLFCSLEHIHNLRQLKAQVDFDLCGLSEHRGLTRILEEHSDHLKSVRLRPIPLRLWQSEWEFGERAFGKWMIDNISNPLVLRDMESLNLRIPCTSPDFDLMVMYLQRSAETLTKLTLAEYLLRYEQIETIVKIFSRKGILKTLSLEVMSLSPQLVDLLATALPNLQVLKLEIHNISGQGEAPHGFRDDTQTVIGLSTPIDIID
jgi:hypothetical protein